MDIEKEYEQAKKQLTEKEMQSIAQWKNLPANHWRHASVNEFEANPIKYFENKYLSNTNSNSKEIQLLKRYFADVLENTIDINIKTQNKKTEQKDIKARENVDGMSLTAYNNRGWAYGLLNAEDIKLLHKKLQKK